MRRHGEPGGNAEAAFDPAERLWYHLDSLGERVYHGCPDGFEFDEAGKIHRLPVAVPSGGTD